MFAISHSCSNECCGSGMHRTNPNHQSIVKWGVVNNYCDYLSIDILKNCPRYTTPCVRCHFRKTIHNCSLMCWFQQTHTHTRRSTFSFVTDKRFVQFIFSSYMFFHSRIYLNLSNTKQPLTQFHIVSFHFIFFQGDQSISTVIVRMSRLRTFQWSTPAFGSYVQSESWLCGSIKTLAACSVRFVALYSVQVRK